MNINKDTIIASVRAQQSDKAVQALLAANRARPDKCPECGKSSGWCVHTTKRKR